MDAVESTDFSPFLYHSFSSCCNHSKRVKLALRTLTGFLATSHGSVFLVKSKILKPGSLGVVRRRKKKKLGMRGPRAKLGSADRVFDVKVIFSSPPIQIRVIELHWKEPF